MKKIVFILLELLVILISIIFVISDKLSFFTPIVLFVSESLLIIIPIIFTKNTIQKQKLEIQNLNYICDTTRTFRHDFNNIMQAIGGYIMTNNIYDLKKYYNKIMPESFKINNLYRFHSKLISNSAIYGVVSDKYNLAESKDIKMSLNILVDLNLLNIDTYTVTRILGILLDNAIEAASECPQKIINLSFQELSNKQLIIVENTYMNKKVAINKIFDKNFTTKKSNSGLGLWEITKLLNRNKNLKLYTRANPDFFLQELEIS